MPQPHPHVALLSAPQYESLVELLCELHAYYHEGAHVPRELVRLHLMNNLLAPDSPLRLVVACDAAGQVTGLAAILLTHSLVDPTPGQSRQCQLKELYVRASSRSSGVGQALMVWLARYAADQGCSRIDWPVAAANARGISFYQGLGAQPVRDRLSFRLTELGLGQLASRGEAA